jgi:hypothetical protein
MESTVDLHRRDLRRVVILLGAIAALLLLLLGGLVAGALWGARALAAVTPVADPGAQMRQVTAELAHRQAVLDHELEAVAAHALHDVEGFRARRAALEDVSGGPLKKMDTVVRLNQLMAEEMLTLIVNTAGMERAIAQASRPLPVEREVAYPRESESPGQGRRSAPKR